MARWSSPADSAAVNDSGSDSDRGRAVDIDAILVNFVGALGARPSRIQHAI